MMRNSYGPVLLAVAAIALVGVATSTSPFLLGGGTSQAVVGRPLTPMSYAGVARRTVRRSAYVGAASAGAVTAGAVATAATLTALPPGCVLSAGIYTCGAVRYRPYYDGPTVVYRTVY